MKPDASFASRQIILFSRFPEPGKTKTRLIPHLGPVGAAHLHHHLGRKMLATVMRGADKANAGVAFCFEGGDEKKIRKWLDADVRLEQQASGNIGRRMAMSLDSAFEKGARQVVLIGSDIPGVVPGHMVEAFSALGQHDLVLGPSADGGYWLVGMNRSLNIFNGIEWSTKKVCDQTLDRAKQRGLKVHLLETLADIDTIDDLKKSLPGMARKKPFVSVVIPAFNEENSIAEAILSARDPEAQIIVADGGSCDRTVDICRELNVELRKSPLGRACQQNAGAAAAAGSILLFLHADTKLPKGYVRQVFEIMMNARTVLGAFRFNTDIRRPAMAFFEKGADFRSRILKLPYGDQALFMRRADFFKAGGFPSVPIAEDLLLVRKMIKKGDIEIAQGPVVTSGRRWRDVGMCKTFFINQIILGGILMGVSPEKLAPLYRKKN